MSEFYATMGPSSTKPRYVFFGEVAGPILTFFECLKVLKAETWDQKTTQLASVGPHYFVHYKGWKQTCVLCFSSPKRARLTRCFRWDEWVPPDRILKFNESNIALQKKLAASSQKAAPVPVTKSAVVKEGASGVASGRGEGREGRGRKEPRGHKRGREEVSSYVFFLFFHTFQHVPWWFTPTCFQSRRLLSLRLIPSSPFSAMLIRACGRQDEAVRKPELRLVVPDVLKVVLVDDWEAVTKNKQVWPSTLCHYLVLPFH